MKVAALGSAAVIVGTIAAAGSKVFGGSKPVKKALLQRPKKAFTFAIWSGIAMRGRYGSPGAGLYQLAS